MGDQDGGPRIDASDGVGRHRTEPDPARLFLALLIEDRNVWQLLVPVAAAPLQLLGFARRRLLARRSLAALPHERSTPKAGDTRLLWVSGEVTSASTAALRPTAHLAPTWGSLPAVPPTVLHW